MITISCDGCYKNFENVNALAGVEIKLNGKKLAEFHYCVSCMQSKEHLSFWTKNPDYIKPKETDESTH